MSSLDTQKVRQDFPILNRTVHGKPLVYLDSAATTQKPLPVLEAVDSFYRQTNANVHRTIYALGEAATKLYEEARQKVADFIGAADPRSIVFTRSTTESINLVAQAWGRQNLQAGDEILITEMEHHSNIVPWQLVTRATGARLRYIPLREDGCLDLKDLGRFFTPALKLVAVVHQSNVFGTINPVDEIIAQAREIGALVLLDGAQSVPHFPVDVEQLDCDFLAFSGHKMLGPTGVGGLYARPELLESMEPFLGGGEMIRKVTMETATWNEIPWKFEAGTPCIAQAIGLGAAIDYLNRTGRERIRDHEQALTAYALEGLQAIPGLTVYGPPAPRGAVISFNVAGVHPADLAQFLDQDGIAIRAGHHCAQPALRRLNLTATGRASFYLYNTRQEINLLCESITKTIKFMTADRSTVSQGAVDERE